MSGNPCAPFSLPPAPRAVVPSPLPGPRVHRAVFERSLTGTLLLRDTGTRLEAVELNPAAAEQLGGTVEELAGPGWSRGLVPADRDRLRAAAAELLAGKRTRTREEVTLPDGRCVLFCLCSLDPDSDTGTPLVLAQLVARSGADTLASVGHELRTPITSMLGYTEVLREGVGGHLNHHQVELLDRVAGNGRRLLDLVEGLLTLDRVGSGDVAVEPEHVALDAVVGRALATVAPRSQGQSVRARMDAEPVVVRGDERDLERVVVELLANALKFTPAGGRVTVELIREGPDAVVVVEDTGPGIAAHDQARVFDRFFRTSRALAHAVPGTGIGLAIVRAVVAAHGGSVGVTSAPEQGARFEVRLPLAATT